MFEILEHLGAAWGHNGRKARIVDQASISTTSFDDSSIRLLVLWCLPKWGIVRPTAIGQPRLLRICACVYVCVSLIEAVVYNQRCTREAGQGQASASTSPYR